jgi:hypothetical protein
MPSSASRPLFSLTLTLVLLALGALLLTAIAIERAEPAELERVFPHATAYPASVAERRSRFAPNSKATNRRANQSAPLKPGSESR